MQLCTWLMRRGRCISIRSDSKFESESPAQSFWKPVESTYDEGCLRALLPNYHFNHGSSTYIIRKLSVSARKTNKPGFWLKKSLHRMSFLFCTATLAWLKWPWKKLMLPLHVLSSHFQNDGTGLKNVQRIGNSVCLGGTRQICCSSFSNTIA